MKLEGRRESQNVDDRRGMKTSTKAGMGIGGLLIAGLLALFLGGDPGQLLQQLSSGAATTTENTDYVATPEEEAFSTRFSPFINERNVEGIVAELQRAGVDIAGNGNAKIVLFDLSIRIAMLIRL